MHLLTADEDVLLTPEDYSQVIEIDLDSLEPHIVGPHTRTSLDCFKVKMRLKIIIQYIQMLSLVHVLTLLMKTSVEQHI